MSDIVFEGMKAWNQAWFLMGGSLLFLVGCGLIGYEIYWRSRAVLVKGRISGIHASNVGDLEEAKLDDSGRENLGRDKKEKRDKKSRKEEQTGKKSGGISSLLVFAFPLLFAVIGASLGYRYLSLVYCGTYADAVVVRNEVSGDSSGSTYYAVVKFRDKDGSLWKVKDRVGSRNSSFKKGEKVGVYYDASNPKRFVIEAFWHYMGIALIFVVVGTSLFAFMCFAFFKHRREEDGNVRGGSSSRSKVSRYSGERYYPVFEYQDLNGEGKSQLGMVGSSSLLSCEVGSKVSLLVFPDNPEKVRIATWLFVVIGWVLAVAGAILLYAAFTMFENTPLSFLLVFVAVVITVVFIASRMRVYASSIEKKMMAVGGDGGISDAGNADAGNAVRSQGILSIIKQARSKAKAGRELGSQEILARVEKQAVRAKFSGYAFLLLAVCCFAGAYYSGQDMLELVRSGRTGVGKVVHINSRRSISSISSRNANYSFFAEVVFHDANGEEVRFEDRIGSSGSLYNCGDNVDVLYDPERPTHAVIDRGVFNWGLSGGLVALSLLLLLIAVSYFKKSRINGNMRCCNKM